MPTNVLLSQLVEDVRVEIGDDTVINVGAGETAALKNRIKRKQQEYYERFDWPDLRFTFEIALQAGERYYDIPTNLVTGKIERVAVFYSGQPVPVERGISFEEYAAYDSDSDERASPVQRWDIKRSATATSQIEVWPIPDADNDQRLQFRGLKGLRALAADADRCDLDSNLIVLGVAADIMAKKDDPGAKRVATRAEELYVRLTGNVQGGGKTIPQGRTPPVFADKAIVRVR